MPVALRVGLAASARTRRSALAQPLPQARCSSSSARMRCSRRASISPISRWSSSMSSIASACSSGCGCRRRASKLGRFPHQLIMTATPIPRTLAMTAYADLDISVIDELPPGRTPVQTVVIPEQRRAARSCCASRQACRAGRQAYWVCPLIDESDELRAQAAEETAARARRGAAGRARRSSCTAACPGAEGRGDGGLQGRQDPAPGRDHGDRGGRRRAQRHPHGDRERRAHGTCAAAPAARPCRARRSREQLRAAVPRAAVAAGARAPAGHPRDLRRLSRSRAAILRCAVRASSSARARRGLRSCASRT